MIPVNKPYLPAFDKYSKYVSRIYEKTWLTNNGPLVQELKLRLEDYLGVKHLLPVANGTLALQLAYKVFNLKGNAVTTPFTFIATSSSLQWQGVQPIFADVDPRTYNLCPDKAAEAINADTSALVPVHVYGNPCNIAAFDELAAKRNIKLIYDASHAFAVKFKQRSLLSFGDAATLSFHATKVFHSVEGGAVIFKNADDYERAVLMTNFGIDTRNTLLDEQGHATKVMNIVDQGINTKMSEFHAAMGLAVLDDIDQILQHRTRLFECYRNELSACVQLPSWHSDASLTGAFMPVTFDTATHCSQVLNELAEQNIIARRYFAPSLNTLEFFSSHQANCPVSEDLATKTLCLPLYFDLTEEDVIKVCRAIKTMLV
jgi:dTDP-4-amino-4,6-dideoxygalactose transaminase